MLEPGHNLHRHVSWTANDTRRTSRPFDYRCLLKTIGFSYFRRTLRGTSTEVVATRGARTGFSRTRHKKTLRLDGGYMLLRLFTEPFDRISHTFYATMDSRDIHTSLHSSDAFRFLFCSPLVLVLVCSLQKGFSSEMVSQHSRSLWKLLVDVISNHFQEVMTARSCSPCFFGVRALPNATPSAPCRRA